MDTEQVNGSPERELTSWKEIAGYFGVTVRTAQKWEQERGLPVRRLPGKRAVVRAAVADLEAWKNSRLAEPLETSPAASEEPPRLTHRTAAVAAMLVIALSVALWAVRRTKGPPASFRFDQTELVIQDASGNELWRKAFPVPLQYHALQIEDKKIVVLQDVDADGSAEIIFSYTPRPESVLDKPAVICFRADGTEMWRFVPGRPVRTATETFKAAFALNGVDVAPIRPGSPSVIAVSSYSFPYYPTQVALLSHDGRLLREYWHSGHFNSVELADIDRDGNRELILGGPNNARKMATLVVLDPGDFGGASVEPPEYQLLDFPPAKQRARIFFPRTCLSKKLLAYNSVVRTRAIEDVLQVAVREDDRGEMVFYHFGPNLVLQDVVLGDMFKLRHNELKRQGIIDHDFTAAEHKALWNIIRE